MPGPTQFPYEVRLPAGVDVPQDEEWCEVVINDRTHHVRLHDYAQVYSVPGLYERLIRDELDCTTPQVVRSLLRRVLDERGLPTEWLRVLEVGAGNGMVGEQLADWGVSELVGVDILPEAAAAAARDRPGVYRDYHVVDLTAAPDRTRQALAAAEFNCVVMVASLGFGDLTPHAFVDALAYLTVPGFVVFSINERFLAETDRSGFGRLLARSAAERVLRPVTEQRYRHRFATSGEPIYYVARILEITMDGAAVADLAGPL